MLFFFYQVAFVLMTLIYSLNSFQCRCNSRFHRKSISSVFKSNSFLHTEIYHTDFTLISSIQWDKLNKYEDCLLEWNSKVNLVSRTDIHNLVPKHIIPSLAMSKVASFLPGESIVDVGTGGGFPGIPLAIAFPDCQFSLIDGSAKKVDIVNDIIKRIGLLNARVIWTRSELFNEKFDHIVGRSVSAIPNFLDFSSHLIASYNAPYDDQHKKGLWYLKGGEFTVELEQAQLKNYSLTAVSSVVKIDSDKYILYVPANEIINYQYRKIFKR